jgi:hypothetical protein
MQKAKAMQSIVATKEGYMDAIKYSMEMAKTGVMCLVVPIGREQCAARWMAAESTGGALSELAQQLGRQPPGTPGG